MRYAILAVLLVTLAGCDSRTTGAFIHGFNRGLQGDYSGPHYEMAVCPQCDGTGNGSVCYFCQGKGVTRSGYATWKCSSCNGRGFDKCYHCKGTGRVKKMVY